MKPIDLLASLAMAVTLSTAMAPIPHQARGGPAFRQENTPENLKSLFETIFRKVHVDKAPAEGIVLFRAMLPDEARLRRAIRTDLAPASFQAILAFHKTMAGMRDDQIGTIARPEQTVVQVHGATTAEIRENRPGSVVDAEFPGGAIQLAENVLAPGMTFYEVEFVEPGRESGIKYHLLYWDGARWSMLGPVWRALSDARP